MPLIEILKLNKKYSPHVVLKDFCLNIERGDIIGLIGPNGVGKSTLIGCICGVVRYDSGKILFDQLDMSKYPSKTKNRIGVCFQDTIFDRFFSIQDSARLVAGYYGLPRKESKNRAVEVLKKMGLFEKRHLTGDKLSGGMKKRFQIALSIIHNPDLIILDEPSAGVDMELRQKLNNMIVELNQKSYKTIVLVSHYLEEIKKLCNKVVFLKDGKIAKEVKKGISDLEYLNEIYEELYWNK